MVVFKKMVCLSTMLLSFACFAQESAGSKDKLERLNYPSMSKVIFKAYLDNDKIRIQDILESSKYRGHKLYLLERAFFYGAKTLKEKEMSYLEQLKCKNAIWSISQDFAEANRPARWLPTIWWTGISTLSFLAGSYAQKQYKTWDDFEALMKGMFQKGKSGKHSGKYRRK